MRKFEVQTREGTVEIEAEYASTSEGGALTFTTRQSPDQQSYQTRPTAMFASGHWLHWSEVLPERDGDDERDLP